MKLSYDSFVKTMLRRIADTANGRIFAVSGKMINCSLAAPPTGSTHRKRGGALQNCMYIQISFYKYLWFMLSLTFPGTLIVQKLILLSTKDHND